MQADSAEQGAEGPALLPPPPNPQPFKVLEKTIEVEAGGEVFELRIPGALDSVRLGAAIRRLRRLVDPESAGPGEEHGWDPESFSWAKSIAIFQTFLVKGPAWVWVRGPDGKPQIDPESWPPGRAERVLEVAFSWDLGVSRFRAGSDQS